MVWMVAYKQNAREKCELVTFSQDLEEKKFGIQCSWENSDKIEN